MARRVIHLILIASADPERLGRRHRLVRDAGYHAIPASGAGHALDLAHKARPSVVLADADLGDDRAISLLRALRALEPLADVHVILLGPLSPEEHAHVARDPHARAHSHHDADTDDESALVALLREVLAA